MDNINVYFKGFVRSSPFIINMFSILIGIIFKSDVGLFYGLYAYGTDIINHYTKIFCKNVLYKNTDYIPLLGYGKRPDNAKNCGIFVDETNANKPATSFGMPSGHSNFATLCATFWIIYILKGGVKYNNIFHQIISILIILSISYSIMISRYYLGCHTKEQIIFGGLMGILFGFIGSFIFFYF
tara:strand:- start:869 stop:1417 length:549 start_codon:yes stop_codon:yes gene_type:complete